MALFPSPFVGTSLWGTGFNFLCFIWPLSSWEVLCLILVQILLFFVPEDVIQSVFLPVQLNYS